MNCHYGSFILCISVVEILFLLQLDLGFIPISIEYIAYFTISNKKGNIKEASHAYVNLTKQDIV